MPDLCGCRSTATSTKKGRLRDWPRKARRVSKKLLRIFDREALTKSECPLYFRLTEHETTRIKPQVKVVVRKVNYFW